MNESSAFTSEWLERIVPNHNVPRDLYKHQIDAMTLLKQGKHVFLGKNITVRISHEFYSDF